MRPIKMVDLQGQHVRIKTELNKAIEDVLNETAFIQGPQVKSFEKNLAEFNNAPFCITCGNGTDALQIAMMALNLKEGDEIIVPAFTYIATVEAAALLKIKVVLADVDPNTFLLTADSVRKVLSPRTKAIVPVHLYGQCCPMDELLELAKEKEIYVIEDAAQSIGAEYFFSSGKKLFAGTMGDIGITSFFPSKNLGCAGDGGALFTRSEDLHNKIRMIANHGQSKKYYHEIIGINSRLDTLQAAILNIKLKYLNDYCESRQKAAHLYDELLNDNAFIQIPLRAANSSHVFHQYTLIVKEGSRNDLKTFLEHKGVPSMIYYPVPIHLQKAYSYLGYDVGDFPISEYLCNNVISLPIHTELEEEQQKYISKTILSFFK